VFLHDPTTAKLLEELKILHRLREAPPPNVARIYGPFEGDDGKVYLAEELLYRPLDALCPLRSGEQFIRIARDLSMGLSALHELRPPIVHRDLKLDNCGIDYTGQAKIFDLGSATSEPGSVKGTTLTRAPELFQPEACCTKETDVWALGAVLLALRCQDYPFVDKSEASSRPLEGQERDRFEQDIRSRALAPVAEQRLEERVKETFPLDLHEVMLRMLAFDPARRPAAGQVSQEWDSLLRSWVRPGKREGVDAQAQAQELAAYMRAVLAREAGMSAMQWERVLNSSNDLRKKIAQTENAELEALQARIKELRESGELS